jgi:hypothetical protein
VQTLPRDLSLSIDPNDVPTAEAAKKKVRGFTYWFTKAGGDTYFGNVHDVPRSEAKNRFNDHVKILAENETASHSKGLTAGDLIVQFLDWVKRKRSRQTFTTRKLYCTRFSNFEISPGTGARTDELASCAVGDVLKKAKQKNDSPEANAIAASDESLVSTS